MISLLSSLMAGELRPAGKTDQGQVSLPLSVGEIVQATVVGRQGENFTILLKGMPLNASSNMPLGEGEKISVRISQLAPRIIMIPLNREKILEDGQQMLQHIRSFKQNPDLLKNIFRTAKDILSASNIEKYHALLPGTDFEAIKARFDSLLFSKDTLEGYAGRLGLFHESAIASGRGTSDNLKAMLQNLWEEIVKAQSEKGMNSKGLAALSEFAVSTISKIEAYQVVNLLSIDKNGLLFLPIPVLFNNEIQTEDLFVSKKETERGKELRVFLFLDMEPLGKVMAEARLTGGRIKCLFRCEDPETCNFLATRVTLLQEGLIALGYQMDEVKCYHEKHMDVIRMEMMEDFPAYREGTLNVTV